jgi:hypothetical protein
VYSADSGADDSSRSEPMVVRAIWSERDWEKEFRTRKRFVVVGRDPSAVICVAGDTRMGGNHAELEHLGNRVAVRDLDSRFGTFVNGARIERYQWTPIRTWATIRDDRKSSAGDVLRIGHVDFRVALPNSVRWAYETLPARPTLTEHEERVGRTLRSLAREGLDLSRISVARESHLSKRTVDRAFNGLYAKLEIPDALPFAHKLSLLLKKAAELWP